MVKKIFSSWALPVAAMLAVVPSPAPVRAAPSNDATEALADVSNLRCPLMYYNDELVTDPNGINPAGRIFYKMYSRGTTEFRMMGLPLDHTGLAQVTTDSALLNRVCPDLDAANCCGNKGLQNISDFTNVFSKFMEDGAGPFIAPLVEKVSVMLDEKVPIARQMVAAGEANGLNMRKTLGVGGGYTFMYLNEEIMKNHVVTAAEFDKLEAGLKQAKGKLAESFKQCVKFTYRTVFQSVSCSSCRGDWEGTYYNPGSLMLKLDQVSAVNMTMGCLETATILEELLDGVAGVVGPRDMINPAFWPCANGDMCRFAQNVDVSETRGRCYAKSMCEMEKFGADMVIPAKNINKLLQWEMYDMFNYTLKLDQYERILFNLDSGSGGQGGRRQAVRGSFIVKDDPNALVMSIPSPYYSGGQGGTTIPPQADVGPNPPVDDGTSTTEPAESTTATSTATSSVAPSETVTTTQTLVSTETSTTVETTTAVTTTSTSTLIPTTSGTPTTSDKPNAASSVHASVASFAIMAACAVALLL